MGKSSRRKLKQKARDFRKNAKEDPATFLVEWNILLDRWVDEIRKRGRDLRDKEISLKDAKQVFAILDRAVDLLTLCGSDIQKAVGDRSLSLLKHECANEIALASSRQMYKPCFDYDRLFEQRRRDEK